MVTDHLFLRTFTGPSAEPYLGDLARLRIRVFREYPYLYEGTEAYEQEYLRTFLGSEESVLVIAFDGERVVGASTGLPLREEPPDLQKPWIEGGQAVDSIYYFSESVLLPAYRGKGLGVRFFEEREARAVRLGYHLAVFCAVIRPEDHPRRPSGYRPLDTFWENLGFRRKEGYIGRIPWRELGQEEESEKELQFWYKALPVPGK